MLGNVQEAVADILAKKQRFDEISALMAEPDADFDALLAEMGTLQEAIDAADAWDLDSQPRAGDGRAALPAAGRRRVGALRW